MINNDAANQLNRYFNRAGNSADGNGSIADMLKKRLKAKQEAMTGKAAEEEQDTSKIAAPNANKQGLVGRGVLRNAKKTESESVDSEGKNKNKSQGDGNAAATADEEELSPMERRERELKAIMDKLNAEEAQRYPKRYAAQQATANSGVTTTTDAAQEGSGGIEGFLNDMPLFSEFKAGLMDAFSRLDSASAGSISAQYELNYSTMQYVANAAGGYEYQETSVNIKLDLNYIKAAAGGKTGKEISDAIDKSTDFASLVENLQNVGQNQAAQQTGVKPEDLLTSMQDYFSPEKTADRILDFSTAFFGNSAAFKKHGDTEEGRAEFAELMRGAIQKGFDQAMGTLGKVPKSVQDGIDKTHELVFNGIDDFVKNGLNRNKQEQGVYNSLEQFALNFQVSYSSKSVSYSSSQTSQNAYAKNYGGQEAASGASAVDAEA